MQKRRFVLIVVIFLLLLAGTSEPANDILGWGGFKWGDSIEKVKEDMKAKNMKVTKVENTADSINLRSTKKMMGGVWEVVLLFGKEEETLRAVVLQSQGDVSQADIMELARILVDKYGETDCSGESILVCEWHYSSGDLILSVFYKNIAYSKGIVKLIYKQNEILSSKDSSSF